MCLIKTPTDLSVSLDEAKVLHELKQRPLFVFHVDG